MTTKYPSDELLYDYASGAASPGVSLLVAAHLTYCAESRQQINDLERLGGVLLCNEPPEPVSEPALERALQAIDLPEEPVEAPARRDAGPLPDAVARAVGVDFNDIPWRFRLPGVHEYDLEGFDGEKVSLLRARPGAGIPQHTHEGRELTLVLAGALQDGETVLNVGDVAEHDDHVDHKPIIIGDETCYCLIVMDGRLRFTGTFSRALNLIGE